MLEIWKDIKAERDVYKSNTEALLSDVHYYKSLGPGFESLRDTQFFILTPFTFYL